MRSNEVKFDQNGVKYALVCEIGKVVKSESIRSYENDHKSRNNRKLVLVLRNRT